MSYDDIQHRFSFHPATTKEKQDAHASVRARCKTLALVLEEELPTGREKAVVMTKLEEVMFWANAAIARNQ